MVNTIVEPEQLWAEVDQWIVDRCYRSCRSHPAVPRRVQRIPPFRKGELVLVIKTTQ